MRRRVIINAIQCNRCGVIIESTYRHDFRTCGCGRVFVDGGHDYLRRGFTDSPEDYSELSVTAEDREEKTITSEKEKQP